MESLRNMLRDPHGKIARLKELAAQVSPEELPPTPPDARICPLCLGFGFIRYELPTMHSDFGKTHRCPNDDCPVIRQQSSTRAMKLKALYSVDMDKAYEDYTFDSWKRLIPAGGKAGKELPYLVARRFARDPFTPFTLSDVLDAAKIDYARQSDDGTEFLTANIRRGVAERFHNSSGNWLVFEGSYGTGKTGLLIATLNALQKRGIFAFYIHLPTFVELYQATYRFEDESEKRTAQQRLTQPLIDAQVLLVDEVNVAETGDGQASSDKIRLFGNFIVQPRWVAGTTKPTVFTTNKGFVDFMAHWSERWAERIAEHAHWLRFVGLPLRHKNRPV